MSNIPIPSPPSSADVRANRDAWHVYTIAILATWEQVEREFDKEECAKWTHETLSQRMERARNLDNWVRCAAFNPLAHECGLYGCFWMSEEPSRVDGTYIWTLPGVSRDRFFLCDACTESGGPVEDGIVDVEQLRTYLKINCKEDE